MKSNKRLLCEYHYFVKREHVGKTLLLVWDKFVEAAASKDTSNAFLYASVQTRLPRASVAHAMALRDFDFN